MCKCVHLATYMCVHVCVFPVVLNLSLAFTTSIMMYLISLRDVIMNGNHMVFSSFTLLDATVMC